MRGRDYTTEATSRELLASCGRARLRPGRERGDGPALACAARTEPGPPKKLLSLARRGGPQACCSNAPQRGSGPAWHAQRWYDLTISMALILVQMGVMYCYIAISSRNRGQPLGKYVMNILVTTDDDKGLSTGESAYRGFVQIFTVALWMISVPLWLFRRDRKTWHDLAAGTKVVSISKANKSAQVIP